MTDPSPRKPPGRPRAFDEDEALDAAMHVFATKGYAGASLSDLTAAMGINRVSMYATFGNKEALFVRAMSRYMDGGCDRIAGYLAAPTARQGVERMLRGSVEGFVAPGAGGVCFITQGPLEPDETTEETRRFVAGRRGEVEAMLAARLTAAQADGELPAGTSPAALARFYAVLIQGLALQAQHGATLPELEGVVEVALAAWPPRR